MADNYKIKPARGLILAFMRLCRFDGWASFWNTAYLREEHLGNKGLIAHEITHLKQIDRDGVLKFSVQYLWWLIRYGYNGGHPYEVEARQAQRAA